MNHHKIRPVILFVLFFGLALIGFNLAIPADIQAHPAYGFTPTPHPPPPPPPDGGDHDDDDDSGGSGGGNKSNDESPPTDYVIVQIERCDMKNCPVSPILISSGQKYKPLALAHTADFSVPMLVPVEHAISPVEIQAQVRLVHEGSGWIAEGVISDAKSTRFTLPYPGRWQVFLAQTPQFMTAEAIDTRSLNIDQLKAQLAAGPISLGTVEANNPETQWVKCPLECVIIEEPPAHLPQTGLVKPFRINFLLVSGLVVTLIGLTLWAAVRYRDKEHLI